MVDRTRPYAASGSAPFFWWLTRRGAHLVEGTSPAPGKAAPEPAVLAPHARPSPASTWPWSTWDGCRADVTAPGDGTRRPGRSGPQGSVGPSTSAPTPIWRSTLDVDGEPARAGAFVEIDFATMDQRRLAAKVARHRDYASDRAWWNRHPGCPALLLLTTSDARVTRFLANLERARPRPSYYGDEDPTAWEPVVAACACVSAPEEALSAPVWRTSAADAPSTLPSLLSADVRTYRRLVATVRAQRAADEQYSRSPGHPPPGRRGTNRWPTRCRRQRGRGRSAVPLRRGAALQPLGQRGMGRPAPRPRDDHARLVGRRRRTPGWPPRRTPWCRVGAALYRTCGPNRRPDCSTGPPAGPRPRLRRPGAALARGTLVEHLAARLSRDPMDRRRRREAALDYEARQDAAVAAHSGPCRCIVAGPASGRVRGGLRRQHIWWSASTVLSSATTIPTTPHTAGPVPALQRGSDPEPGHPPPARARGLARIVAERLGRIESGRRVNHTPANTPRTDRLEPRTPGRAHLHNASTIRGVGGPNDVRQLTPRVVPA